MKIDILGTKYKIKHMDYEDYPRFKEKQIDGECSPTTKEIIVGNLWTFPQFDKTRDIYSEKATKLVLKREIVHAFFNESGLQECCFAFSGSWAQNEELVDWIALQGEKIHRAWKQAGCLD